MPLDFSHKPDSDRPLVRPPDYSARGTRFRLFGLAAAVMLVLTAASYVRDPNFWHFMGWKQRGIAGGPPLTKAEVATHKVDTELRLPPEQSAGEFANSVLLGTEEAAKKKRTATSNSTGSSVADSNEETVPDPFTDPKQRAWFDGWTTVGEVLTQEDRSLLFKGLKFARDGKKLSGEDLERWPTLVETTTNEWKKYLQSAQESLAKLPDAERAEWTALVEHLTETWTKLLQPALVKIGEGEKLPDDQAHALAAAQEILDHVALLSVEDSTLLRAVETESWFRFFEKLQHVDRDELRKQSTGLIGFLQLYKQPKFYRGKLVTVRGTARVAYYVVAPKNMCDIAGYYVFWVYPAGGPDSPFVIYSLEKPDGFPQIKKQSQKIEDNQLHEDVEFTAYSFKRWAYPSRGGIHMAPLLLAKKPRWEPSPADLYQPPTTLTILLIVAGCGVGAVAFAIYAFRRSNDVVRPQSSFSTGFKKGVSE